MSPRYCEPLPPGPRGKGEPWICVGCGKRRAAYKNETPKGWDRDDEGRAWCAECQRPRRARR